MSVCLWTKWLWVRVPLQCHSGIFWNFANFQWGFFRKCIYELINDLNIFLFIWFIKKDELFHGYTMAIQDLLDLFDGLYHPDYSAPFIFIADVSNKVLGFTMSQKLSSGFTPILMRRLCLWNLTSCYCVANKKLLDIFTP